MSIFIIMYNEIEIKQKIEGVLSSCNSMKDASTKLGIGYRTLKKYATRFGLFRPNQSGKGIPSKLLQDVFSGKKTLGLQTLRKRLIQEKFLEYRCSSCSIESWQDSPIILEMDHINGDKTDNRLKNLRLLCPNCHSQTATYRNKNKKRLSDERITREFNKSKTFNDLCIRLGVSNRGSAKMSSLRKRLNALGLFF
mgnify:CR=1 FL=1